MRPITTAFVISTFALTAGSAYAESTMSSGDLIKAMSADVENSAELQSGRNSAAGGDGPAITNAPREDASDGASAGSDEYLRQSPQQPLN